MIGPLLTCECGHRWRALITRQGNLRTFITVCPACGAPRVAQSVRGWVGPDADNALLWAFPPLTGRVVVHGGDAAFFGSGITERVA